jgi:Ca-activated chloride channel family protein
MAALARDSNGRHFFVARPDGLATIFDQEMDALTHTVANGAELVVDLAPGVFADQVFDRVTTGIGSQVVVPLGAFTAGDHKTVLVQLTVPAGTVGERPVASVRLRYDDLVEARPGTCEGSVAALLTADPSQLSPLDGVVSARVSSSETAAALETANKLWRDGDGEGARAVLQSNAGKIAERRHAAKAAAPRGRGAMVDKSFDDQARVLEAATGGFSADPAPRPATTPSAAPPMNEPAAEQIRANQKDAFDLAN